MPEHFSARWTGFLFLAVTSTGWAANWVAIKILLREWPPLFSRGVSGVAAAMLIGGVALAFRESLKVPRCAVVPLLFAAFTNVFAWMGFGTMAMNYLAVSEGTLLVYTMPIWATLFAWPMLGKRPTLARRRRVAARRCRPRRAARRAWHRARAGQIDRDRAGACRRHPVRVRQRDDEVAAADRPDRAGGLAGRARLPADDLFRACCSSIRISALSPAADCRCWSTWCSARWALCYLAWFAALRRLPAATAAIGTLSVPIIGVIAAAIVLGEPLGVREVLAMALTLAGVALGDAEAEASGGESRMTNVSLAATNWPVGQITSDFRNLCQAPK